MRKIIDMNTFINKYAEKPNGKYSHLAPETELCELFYKYGADKCPQVSHTYSKHYFDLLFKNKNKYKNILEIGVGNRELMRQLEDMYQIGASLKAWQDFFPNANIFALDIREDVLFEENRIKCFYGDQSQKDSLIECVSNIKSYINSDIEFDMILDDGSHHEEHQILSLDTLFKFVKNGGIYIIEDIDNSKINNFINHANNNNYKILYTHIGDSQGIDSFIAFEKN
jgi:hypothetical protein